MNFSNWADRQAEFQPDKTAILFEGQAISFADLAERSRNIARYLKNSLNLQMGDRIAFLGFNNPDMIALLIGAARIGVIVLPLNWRLAVPEHVYIMQNAGASALLVEEEFKDAAEQIGQEVDGLKLISHGFDADGWGVFDQGVKASTGDDARPEVTIDAPLLMVYTSGTTGRPKGAVLRQSALLWNAANSHHMHDMTSRDVILNVLPMFHVGGLNIQTLPALQIGATVVISRKFDPGETLRLIGQEKPTFLVLVPATIRAVLMHPNWQSSDLSSLRAMTTGSSIVPNSLIEPWHERDIPALVVYGSTETGPVSIYLRAEQAVSKIGTTGLAALHGDMKVVDDNGQPTPVGAVGEILVRGPNIMDGYWNDPEATAKALRDGWYYTEDLGMLDDDGFLTVVDRKKDMIISGGENIYPAELEEVLHRLDGVIDAAVVGRADEKWGEIPVAVIEKHTDAALDREGILKAFEGQLARFKHPRDVIFMDEMPRNSMGKVQKFILRDMI